MKIVADVEEVGRRLRALHIAMKGDGDHQDTVALYEKARLELYPSETQDPQIEGSWGWWAGRILVGP